MPQPSKPDVVIPAPIQRQEQKKPTQSQPSQEWQQEQQRFEVEQQQREQELKAQQEQFKAQQAQFKAQQAAQKQLWAKQDKLNRFSTGFMLNEESVKDFEGQLTPSQQKTVQKAVNERYKDLSTLAQQADNPFEKYEVAEIKDKIRQQVLYEQYQRREYVTSLQIDCIERLLTKDLPFDRKSTPPSALQ